MRQKRMHLLQGARRGRKMKVPTKNFAMAINPVVVKSLALACYGCALALIISALCGNIVDPVHVQDYRCMGMAGVALTIATMLFGALYKSYTTKASMRPIDHLNAAVADEQDKKKRE
jgi:hypothetical protein